MNDIMSYNDPTGAAVLVMIERQDDLQPSTKAKYSRALSGYLATGARLGDAAALGDYARGLPRSGRAFLKAAVRLWGDDLAQQVKAGATPDNIGAVLATVARVEALQGAIKVDAIKGQKSHTWLSQAEVKRLLDTCPATLQGKRDRLVLSLLVGAGLRREELAGLMFDHLATLPVKGKFRTVLNIVGKGAKARGVPVSDRLAALLDEWQAITGPGHVARSVGKSGQLGGSLSAPAIFGIVARAGAAIGRPELAPHDLRRSYAQLGYEAGISILQVSKLLGHSNVATTQRYLNLDLDLTTTISDFIPITSGGISWLTKM